MTPERFARFRAALDRRQPDLTVLAEDVHKTHNISALLRTCDAVGIPELHAVSREGEFIRHHMVSGGTRKWVHTRIHEDIVSAIGELRHQGFAVVAAHLSPDAFDYRAWDYTRPTVLLVGSELTGVSVQAATLADACLAVPMRGLVESLNVSVATALILYEAARQREAAGLYRQCRIAPETYARVLFEWCYPAVAGVCRSRGIPYPGLDDKGFIVRPELARSLKAARGAPHTQPRTSGAVS